MSSYVKFPPNLLVGSKELMRMQEFGKDALKYILEGLSVFGLSDRKSPFINGLVSQGTNVGTIKHNEIYAFDSSARMIHKAAADNIAIPDDNAWYWIKITHEFTQVEKGLVSIDVQGNLTGTGTEFLSILRGQSQSPTRIRFYGSSNNIYEYDVNEVVSDSQAVLVGDFIAESNLTYSVVGTFSPDAVPSDEDKKIYHINGCIFELQAEETLNTPPAHTEGIDFFLARVKRNGSSLLIEDKRSTNILQTVAQDDLGFVSVASNPLIGVESVRHSSLSTPRDENLVDVAWTFRSSNWSIDSSVNRLTLITGQGGKYKSTANFVNGDFDGWRVYTKGGKFHKVLQSSLSAGQINLTLDSLDPIRFEDTTQQVIVAPDADEIELIFTSHAPDAYELANKRISFPINSGLVSVPLIAYKQPSCLFNVKYRYKAFKAYGPETLIPSDPTGYYVESNFSNNGVRTGSVTKAYVSHVTNGFIELVVAANAYVNRITNVETGDRFGIGYLVLDNTNPVKPFRVGEAYANQIITLDDIATVFPLTVDHYIDLRTDGSVRNGNTFTFNFMKGIRYSTGAFKLIFTQNFVNSGDPGTVVYTVSASDFMSMANGSLRLKFVFDGTNWILEQGGKIITDKSAYVHSGDMNDILQDGLYYIDPVVTNKPAAAGWVIVQRLDDNNLTQTWFTQISNSIITRRKFNGSWTSWETMLTTTAAETVYAKKNQSGWVNITLAAGWTVSGALTPQYRIDEFGQVHLRGEIQGSGVNNMFLNNGALPSPAVAVNRVVPYSPPPFTSFGSTAYAHILIGVNGNAFINKAPQWANTGNVTASFSLTGISYWP